MRCKDDYAHVPNCGPRHRCLIRVVDPHCCASGGSVWTSSGSAAATQWGWSMPTFAQGQHKPRPVMSGLARSRKAASGPHHGAGLTLHLQRTMANRAGQRMWQTGLSGTASPRFGHDFIRIPVRASAAEATPMHLAIDKPADEHERVPDHVLAPMTRMPEPQLQRACTCGGGCPECQTAQAGQEQERLATRRVSSSAPGQTRYRPSSTRYCVHRDSR